MKRILLNALCSVLLSQMIYTQELPLKEYEKFWEYKSRDKAMMEEFARWWGNENAISRILVRLHILHKEYKSVLDVGCGFCVDYYSFKKSCPEMEYLGIDMASSFVTLAQERGVPILMGKAQNLPCEDSSYDVVYARHLLEHLDSYQDAIKEMVRVAKKEVLIVFFSSPEKSFDDKGGMVNLSGYSVYQNRYSKPRMGLFLKTIEKVKSFSWQEVKNKDEVILHILV